LRSSLSLLIDQVLRALQSLRRIQQEK